MPFSVCQIFLLNRTLSGSLALGFQRPGLLVQTRAPDLETACSQASLEFQISAGWVKSSPKCTNPSIRQLIQIPRHRRTHRDILGMAPRQWGWDKSWSALSVVGMHSCSIRCWVCSGEESEGEEQNKQVREYKILRERTRSIAKGFSHCPSQSFNCTGKDGLFDF